MFHYFTRDRCVTYVVTPLNLWKFHTFQWATVGIYHSDGRSSWRSTEDVTWMSSIHCGTEILFVKKRMGEQLYLPTISVRDSYFTFKNAIRKSQFSISWSTMEHRTLKKRSRCHPYDVTGAISSLPGPNYDGWSSTLHQHNNVDLLATQTSKLLTFIYHINMSRANS